ncbi:TetR/AcrR family transcriptional regulator [Salinisphaera sp. SPP-AMP-43]|uniref:TetR/AcrR family transcriptional regulator n=1 Tax=Salinisphaera sp. SPP-AMP-43 TaxID=3121288 RepID=UPI003C6DF211
MTYRANTGMPAVSTGRYYAGLSSDERRSARREALIAAGLRVFGSVGFRGATVKAVCREAGLTERYFYESFANSEALFAAVYRDCVQRLEDDLTRGMAEAGDSTEAATRHSLQTFFEHISDPQTARVLLIEIFGISAEIDRVYRSTTLHFAGLIEALLGRVYALDRLPAACDRRILAMGLIGSTIHIAMYWALNHYRDPLETIVETNLELYRAMQGALENMA